MENEPTPNDPASPLVTPGKTRRWSPFIRLGLLTLFLLTLPFTWGETSSCNGPSRTFTGFEHATRSTTDAISFFVIFTIPVLMAFLQYFARPAWLRLGFECIAGMFASLGTFYCFVSAVISGDITHKSSRVYPAPWVATIVMVLMTFDACRGAVQELKTMWQARGRPQNVDTPRRDNDSGV